MHLEIEQSIRVRYFASLKERMGQAEEHIASKDISTVLDVWHSVSGEDYLPNTMLCAINMEYAAADALVKAGDEVAFFPPVTGG
jgi:molybdopterin synthase sulfur carrier subunit